MRREKDERRRDKGTRGKKKVLDSTVVSLHAAAYKAAVSKISPPILDVISVQDGNLHNVSLQSI